MGYDYLLHVQFAEIEKILSEVDDTCFGMYTHVAGWGGF